MKATKSKPRSSKRRSSFITQKEAEGYKKDPILLAKHEEAFKFLDTVNWKQFRALIKILDNR